MNDDDLKDQINELIRDEIQDVINEYVDTRDSTKPVSYTHLTLPTIAIV